MQPGAHAPVVGSHTIIQDHLFQGVARVHVPVPAGAVHSLIVRVDEKQAVAAVGESVADGKIVDGQHQDARGQAAGVGARQGVIVGLEYDGGLARAQQQVVAHKVVRGKPVGEPPPREVHGVGGQVYQFDELVGRRGGQGMVHHLGDDHRTTDGPGGQQRCQSTKQDESLQRLVGCIAVKVRLVGNTGKG